MRFIVDANVGKLARWLRLMGYDAAFFEGGDDGEMISTALAEQRVILTRDTHIMEWGIVKKGRITALLIQNDIPELQIRQVVKALKLDAPGPFTVCLECNYSLRWVAKSEIKDRVPPYVFITQDQFMECPNCRRVYWRGTHWRSMLKKLQGLSED